MSGKNRCLSINNPASNPNHKKAMTGAVDRYVAKYFITQINVFDSVKMYVRLIGDVLGLTNYHFR